MTLDQSEILARLREAFAEASIPLEEDLGRDLFFKDIDGVDFVSRVRLLMSIEEAFAIEITPKESSGLDTIGEMVDFIDRKLGV